MAEQPKATVVAKSQVDPTKVATNKTAITSERAFNISALDEDEGGYIKMLVYAAHGTGKTTLMGSAADVEEMRDVLVLDFESGKMTLKDNPRIEHPEYIDTIRITNFKQLGKVHEYLKQHCRARDNDDEKLLKELQSKFTGVPIDKIKRVRRYQTVGIDSLSELDTLSMYEMLGIGSDSNLNEVMNGGEMATAEWGEYKKNNQMLQLVIRAYRDLPINVILVCHSAFTQDEAKRMLYAPALTGKLQKQVQGFVDIVGYMKCLEIPPGSDAKEAPRRMYLHPVGKFDAKCRIASSTVSWLDDPTMTEVWDLAHNQ